MLQEYVQDSHAFRLPSNHTVLQWTVNSQMKDEATLEFRATVAFLLEGVPHHVAGSWQPKKRDAQRDTAERALNLFVGKWGEYISQKKQSPAPLPCPSSGTTQLYVLPEALLEEYCQQSDACSAQPSWSVSWVQGLCRATAKLTLLGVPHHFGGAACSSEEEARRDVAGKVLWYLQCPDFQDAYEPDPTTFATVAGNIPPPSHWDYDPVSESAMEAAERKTAIMRVQNRLQQTFAHRLRPGVSVWTWSYEMDPHDESWPTLCRASVHVPVIGKTFPGDWVRGQRDAQLDTVAQVNSFLDEFANARLHAYVPALVRDDLRACQKGTALFQE